MDATMGTLSQNRMQDGWVGYVEQWHSVGKDGGGRKAEVPKRCLPTAERA